MSTGASLYVDRNSPIHRLTARATLASLMGVFVAAYVFGDPVFVLGPLLVALVVLLLVGGWPNLKRLLPIVIALFVVGLVVWPAFTPQGGPVLLSTPIADLTQHELLFALGRTGRIITFIFGGLVFVTTTTNEEIVAGLRSLGIPFAFCFAIGTALRLFPTILGATGTVRQAQAARGHEIGKGGPLDRIRSYIPLLIPVFMTAIRNVSTQSMALEARGFDTRRERTFYNRHRFRPPDWLAVGLGVTVSVGSIVLSTLGYGTL